MQKLLEELFAAYYQDVYRYLYSLCRDVSLAEELVAETFLEIVKSVALFRAEADIKTWIFSIARHRWLRYLRRKREDVSIEDIPGELMAPGKPLEQQCMEREMAERIYELLGQEPERTGQVVHMRLEGYSFREIGVKLGISENSARVIEFRAKQKIREILRKEGFEDV